MRKHVHDYTMIEILMVIVIAAILFGIGIPAFSTLTRGNAMTISVRQLTAKIQAARSYAVTNRCKVAIVFPAGDTGFPKSSFFYSAYRVCVVTGDTSPWTFDSWIDGEEWKRLPTGVLVESLQGGSTVNNCTVTDIGGSTPVSFSRCLIFKPDGQLSTTSSTITLYLAYGRYISGTTPVFTETEGGNVVYHRYPINIYTGKVDMTQPAVTTKP